MKEEPGRRQEGARTGGAWRNPGHNGGPRWSRQREDPWSPTPGRQSTVAEQVVEKPEMETESKVDGEDPEGQCGADGAINRGGDPEGRSGAGARED